ncbi:hypothetical protein KFK09_022452 [Dendrobium nobile]|uniref:Uncharacterized protein n=1 Tax=Dendrobium nobile TaxID=94219 RepID=A0A8T3APW9_DENNO|nr:hypothetical protein KFK09_022452 [Dendrobium nobile]
MDQSFLRLKESRLQVCGIRTEGCDKRYCGVGSEGGRVAWFGLQRDSTSSTVIKWMVFIQALVGSEEERGIGAGGLRFGWVLK